MPSAGELLRGARLAAGVRQQELAERAGTSRSTLSAYEHGHKVPSVDTLARLLSAMGQQLQIEPSVVWTEYTAGPGRCGWVPSALWRLPVTAAMATVVLPVHLNWSVSGRAYDVRDRRQRARLYEIVLREGGPDELFEYIDGALLVDLWPELVLPRQVRRAWESVLGEALGPIAGVVAS